MFLFFHIFVPLDLPTYSSLSLKANFVLENHFQNQKNEMKCCSDKQVHTKSAGVDVLISLYLSTCCSSSHVFFSSYSFWWPTLHPQTQHVQGCCFLAFIFSSSSICYFSHPRIEVCKTAGMACVTFLGFAYLNAVKKNANEVCEREGFLLKLVFSLYGAGMGFSWIMLRPAGFPYTSQINSERVIWIYITEVFEVLQLLFCHIVHVRSNLYLWTGRS